MGWKDQIVKSLLYPSPRINRDRIELQDKICVVTGASSGIGLALTRQLLYLGAKVICLCRHTETLTQLAQEVEGLYIYPVDFKERQEVIKVAEEIAKEHPQINYLFVNAGKSICRNIPDTLERLHDYERSISVNYLAHVALLLALRHALRRARGRVIYSGSVSLLYPYAPKWSAYHASKGAMEIWLRTAKVEWHKEGISVGIAYLPLVHTPMSAANPSYRHLIGYSADEAASLLLRLSQQRYRSSYSPWWARLTAPLARLLTGPLTYLYKRLK